MSARTIYVTTGSRDEGLAIGREFVAARLAACANVLGGVTSVYRWQGEVLEDTEAIVVLKTREDLVDAIVERVGSHALCWVHAERLIHKLVGFNHRQRQACARIRARVCADPGAGVVVLRRPEGILPRSHSAQKAGASGPL